MQSSFHILALVAELRREIPGGTIVATEFYRKERAAYIFIKNKQRSALAFVFHPTKFGTYHVPASKVKLTTREKPWPFFNIVGGVIRDVRQVGFDRIVAVDIEREGKSSTLIIEAIGPNGNIWLTGPDGTIEATLRKRDISEGQTYEPASLPDKLNPLDLSDGLLAGRIEEHSGISLGQLLDRQVLGFNRTLAIEAVRRAGVENVSVDDAEEDARTRLREGIETLVKMFGQPETGYLYSIKGVVEAYPFRLSSSDQQPEKFKSLSLAVMAGSERRLNEVKQQDEEKTVKDALKRAVKRLERRVKHLEGDIEHAADYERYRKYGELLQINFTRLKRGMEKIEVEDPYTGESIEIALDPSLSPQENSDSYFKKYRKGKEGLTLLERRLAISLDELKELTAIKEELEFDFDRGVQRFSQEIESLLPQEGVKRETQERLPYREYMLSTGLRIFVGRDGSDNDRTTFEFARPYELWFHTQQCPGSHVVMKFPNKSFEPSKREIEETAAIAAYFSKARNDSLVPVAYVERKHVRKPRKAKPGLVTVEREKSVMVPPTKPENFSSSE